MGQLKALLKKNYLIKRRHLGASCCESLSPVIIIGLLAMIFLSVGVKKFDPILDHPAEPIPGISEPFYNFDFNRVNTVAFAYAPQGDARVEAWVAKFKELVIQRDQELFDARRVRIPRQPMTSEVLDPLLMGFDSSEAIDEYVRTDWTQHFWGAVVFDNPDLMATGASGTLRYTLRLNSTHVPSAKQSDYMKIAASRRVLVGIEDTVSSKYIESFFVTAQLAIDEALYYTLNGGAIPASPDAWSLETKKAPTLAYEKSEFTDATAGFLPLILVITFMVTIRFLLTMIVTEKEKHLREGMEMMGMRTWAYWLSYWLTALASTFPTLFLVSVILKASILSRSDFFLMVVFFWLLALGVIAYTFLVSTLFKTARAAGPAGMILFYLMQTPQALAPTAAPGTKTALCIFLPSALGYGTQAMIDSEVAQTGIKWANVSDGEFPFANILIMLLINVIYLSILAWYFDAVLNGGHPLHFCFTSAYWKGPEPVQGSGGRDHSSSHLTGVAVEMQSLNEDIEKVPPAIAASRSVQIENLTKTFKSKTKGQPDFNAVDNLSLDLYDGQVLALLGHNGAGKTTLISMLTGLLRPDGGEAWVGPHQLTNDIWSVRRDLGVCPQHDLLFDDLTIREHLVLFATLKGVPPEEMTSAIDKVLRDTQLHEMSFMQSNELSGGQKRKLSVGIAYVGGSKIVFLDEPSAGVDAQGRRDIWDIINLYREGRTTILTSHDMTEADTLGDRVAVLSRGKLQCAGTSLFLKNRFGIGYTLTLMMDVAERGEGILAPVEALVRDCIPNTQDSPQTAGAQLCFLLPLSSVESFPSLLSVLDERGDELGILSYGLSVSTLEEVFLNLAHEQERADLENGGEGNGVTTDRSNSSHSPSPPAVLDVGKASDQVAIDADKSKTDGIPSIARTPNFMQQLSAIIRIRVSLSFRDKGTFFLQIMLPVLFIFFGILAMELQVSTLDFDTSDETRVMNFAQSYQNPIPWSSASAFPAGSRGAAMVNYMDSTAATLTSQATLSDVNLALSPERDANTGLASFADSDIGLYFPNTTRPNNFQLIPTIPPTHVLPTTVNLVSNSLLRSGAGSANIEVETTSQALPAAKGDVVGELVNIIGGSVVAIYVAMGLAFYPAVVVSRVTRDRETKVKHQQLISGVRLATYWFANFLWDITLYLVPMTLSVIVLLAFQVNVAKGNEGSIIMLFLWYGLCCLPWAYCFSLLFTKHNTAQTSTIMLLLLLGMVTVVATMVFMILEAVNGSSTWTTLIRITTPIFSVLPTYSAGAAIMRLAFNQGVQKALTGKAPHALGWDYMGMSIFYLTVLGVACLILLIAAEYMVHTRRRRVQQQQEQKKGDEETTGFVLAVEDSTIDSDVAAEATRMTAEFGDVYDVNGNNYSGDDQIAVHRLRKVFHPKQSKQSKKKKNAKGESVDKKVAVKNLSLGIPRGEVFGLLGTNGAGKSTTLNMLACDLVPTSGTAIMAGHSIQGKRTELFRNIGFCPQYNPLIELLTCVEVMTFYANIRGVAPEAIPGHVQDLITILGLEVHKNKLSKDLSGGNKRKLVLACSMIGTPDILFLDEPSTGLDPASRRVMWDALQAYKHNRNIILTTHTMEEADALCSRIGIMVSGELKCLGTSQHLKSKFGRSYELEISTSPVDTEKLQSWIEEKFPQAEMVESHHGHHRYALPRDKIESIGKVFEAMHGANGTMGEEVVIDYSISQPTLERIFITFAKEETN